MDEIENIIDEQGRLTQIFPPSAMSRTLQSMMDPRPPKRVKNPAALRRFHLEHAGEPCFDCELRPGTEAHHVVFRSQGGNDEESNLVLLCSACHRARHGIG